MYTLAALVALLVSPQVHAETWKIAQDLSGSSLQVFFLKKSNGG
jgi:hypothetical protein